MTGAELKSLRLSISWTAAHLAKLLDVNPITVYRWERARKIPCIVAIATKAVTQVELAKVRKPRR